MPPWNTIFFALLVAVAASEDVVEEKEERYYPWSYYWYYTGDVLSLMGWGRVMATHAHQNPVWMIRKYVSSIKVADVPSAYWKPGEFPLWTATADILRTSEWWENINAHI